MRYGDCVKNINFEPENVIQIDRDFPTSCFNVFKKVTIKVFSLLKQKGCGRILFLISCNSLVIYYLWNWSSLTNSISLKAFANTILFNNYALVVCMISIWVENNTLQKNSKFLQDSNYDDDVTKFLSELSSKSNFQAKKGHRSLSSPVITGTCVVVDLNGVAASKNSDLVSISVLGVEKYEVLALFVSSCISLIAGSFIVIEAISRIGEQPVIINENKLGLSASLGLVLHIFTIVAHPDASLNHVVCKALPCPTLKGINPILGGSFINFVILWGVHIIIQFWKLYSVDTAAVFAIIGLTSASMLPLAFFTATTIIQKLSHHLSLQLDKCLRDALIIDGVLEFKNERFWTQSFGKLAGSLEVRIRKDADENYVLRRVVNKLSQVVSTLKVQEFHDSRCSFMEFPLEYYVDELLGYPKLKKKTMNKVQKQEETNLEKNIKIEDFLYHRTSLPTNTEVNPSYATLWCKERDYSYCNKNYLYRYNSIKNALLLGIYSDHEDFYSTTKLYTQK